MAKRKQLPEKNPRLSDSAARSALPGEADAAGAPAIPSSRIRSLLTVALIAHGFLLLVSYGSIVEPSDVQLRLKQFFSWYLNPLHLNVDGRPVFLLHQGEDTAAMQFQVRALPTGARDESSSETGWQPVPRVGWVGGEGRKRYQRWAVATGRLVQQQQIGMAGMLARRAVIDDDAQALRLVFLSNPFTEQLPYFEREVYRAALVREAEKIRFVQLNESRQNAAAREATAGSASDRGDGNDATLDEEQGLSQGPAAGADR